MWAKLQVERNVKRLLDKAPPLIKNGLKDEHMCECVQELIDDTVDEVWPEIEEEVLN